ncbi:MAG: hypothetical protein KME30_19480 [Iphinoe sp. HA4291-MV1]|nr:hypothetical protein [Iphinoe sp. HA4291-MV1]
MWGNRNKRVEVSVKSDKKRQTYFAAFDYYSKQFTLKQYPKGNTESTIKFLDFLCSQFPDSKLYIK